MKISKERKEFEWKSKELFDSKKLKSQIQPSGYEAFRVSPRTTTKFGKQYKKIYGATIQPDYSKKIGKNYGVKVEWYPHGYTSKNVKGGTRLLTSLKNYPVDKKEVRMKLMLKK